MKESNRNADCAIIATLKLFSAKWKPCILSHLMSGELRYSELLRTIPTITKKMLTEHLKELQNDGIVDREVFPSVPPQVTYRITEKGRSLEGLFNQISEWGVNHIEGVRPMEEMLEIH